MYHVFIELKTSPDILNINSTSDIIKNNINIYPSCKGGVHNKLNLKFIILDI